MILKNSSLEMFIGENKFLLKRWIVFGTGVIAHVLLRYLCDEIGSFEHVLCAIDNDENKIGGTLKIGKKQVPIFDISYLRDVTWENTILLITASHYYGILQQLDKMSLSNTECYILPIMCTSNLKVENENIIHQTRNRLIPKCIHYMWFGSKQLPKSLQYCVDSWKKYCPDYEIKCWNESNYDIEKNLYMKQAYEKKQWGFIPDYARLDLLYEYGGIYMDTDVELLRSLDELLYQEAFTSTEKWRVVNIGGCTGAIKGHSEIYRILNFRKDVSFFLKNGSMNRMASGYYDTIPFMEQGFKLNGKTQVINGMTIYGYDFFHPYDYMTGETVITKNTFAIHHFSGTWMDENTINQRNDTQIKYKKILKSI